MYWIYAVRMFSGYMLFDILGLSRYHSTLFLLGPLLRFSTGLILRDLFVFCVDSFMDKEAFPRTKILFEPLLKVKGKVVDPVKHV